MRLKQKFWWREAKNDWSVAQAIEAELEDDSDDSVTRAIRTGNNANEFLGKLVQLLNDKGVISDDEILALMPGSWEKIEDEEAAVG